MCFYTQRMKMRAYRSNSFSASVPSLSLSLLYSRDLIEKAKFRAFFLCVYKTKVFTLAGEIFRAS